MNGTLAEASELATGIRRALPDTAAEVVVCPPFTALSTVAGVLAGSRVAVGAQNMYFEPKGAYTGEISPAMLTDVGCGYVILGHSERRRQMSESSELVNRKLRLALASGLIPIVCIGETWPERSGGETEQVIREQIAGSLASVRDEELADVVLAYEPVWAIGTGQVATPEQAEEVHRFVRGLLPAGVARRIRILYGGSVTADNAAGLLVKEDLDGALVGGASLKADSFAAIVQAAGA